MCKYVSVCVHAHMYAGVYTGQKKALDPLELALQAIISCPTWT